MDRFKYLISRSNILFLLALLTGIFLPQAVEIGSALIIPALMVILTITLLRFPRGFFRHPGSLISPAIWGNVINYLVWGNLIILTSIFVIREDGLWVGMVLIAAIPPSVLILPLSKLLPTDKTFALAGLAGAYLGALLITPLIGLGFLKYMPLNYLRLILLIVGLILLPLALSRLAVEKEWDKIIKNYKTTITDWCFFSVFYTLAASSRHLIVPRILDVVFIAVIAIGSTFLFGFIIEILGVFYRVPKEKITSVLLLGTMKNYGLAGGIAINVINKEAAFPSVVFAFVTFIYINWLKYKARNIVLTKKQEQKKAIKI